MIKVSITDFGAKSNTEVLQTTPIQKAIDYSFEQGGGTVVIPAGRYITGGIRLRSNITLYLEKDARLLGSRNPEDYFGYLTDAVEPLSHEMITDSVQVGMEDFRFFKIAGSRWNNGLIRAICAENIAIIGEEGSYIDGQDCFDALGEEHYRGPHAINMHHCRNITFKGYCVENSANWAHALFYCENICMQNVTVNAGHDGIHLNACSNVTLKDSKFYTGDDCVAGFANLNVHVKNCILNSACSGLRFGGTNAMIEKCHIYGPCKYLFRGSMTPEEKKSGEKPSLEGHRCNMLSAFTYFADFSLDIEHQPGNIVISDCKIDYADRFLHYNYSGNEIWQANRPLSSIIFRNIEATDIGMPFTAYGDKENPIDLTIQNANISFRKGAEEVDFMHLCHFKTLTLQNVNIANKTGGALIKKWSDGNMNFQNVTVSPANELPVVDADEKFVCRPI